jgi:hypothetical protein
MDKHQTRSTKLPNEFQYQKFELPNKIVSVISNWCLGFVWDLDFGIWDSKSG